MFCVQWWPSRRSDSFNLEVRFARRPSTEDCCMVSSQTRARRDTSEGGVGDQLGPGHACKQAQGPRARRNEHYSCDRLPLARRSICLPQLEPLSSLAGPPTAHRRQSPVGPRTAQTKYEQVGRALRIRIILHWRHYNDRRSGRTAGLSPRAEPLPQPA